jgi:DNA-binding IclR family transcriptional regulator
MGNDPKPLGDIPIPGTQVLSRAVEILSAFTDDRPRWTLSELNAELGLKKSTTHRIMSALEGKGFLIRMEGETQYRLGPELIVLGARALKAVDLQEHARPELRFLAETTGETATLETLVEGNVLIVHEEKGHALLSFETEVGTRWPVHATATGKVLIAFAENEYAEPPGGLLPLTGQTIVSWGKWLEVLSEVREKGFATNLEEIQYGYASVAAPVWDRAGRTIAAVSIGGPVHRVTRPRIPELAKTVKAAGLRVSERIGYRSDNE